MSDDEPLPDPADPNDGNHPPPDSNHHNNSHQHHVISSSSNSSRSSTEARSSLVVVTTTSSSTTRAAPPRPQQPPPPPRWPSSHPSHGPHSTTIVSQSRPLVSTPAASNHTTTTATTPTPSTAISAMTIGPSASNLSASTSISQPPQHPYPPHHHHQQQMVSIESPLPPMVQRSLGDRSNEKRKNAALEIEALIRSLQEANNWGMIQSVVAVLSKDFCTSMNSNYRKGGLVGLAATAIGLMNHTRNFLNLLLPPVLHCFDDPESRVRYYACESLYNMAKVSREAVLLYFNQIFEGLAKLYADVDVDVKNGASLLDRLIKDIVTEADLFHIDQFLPLLQNYIRRSNPFIRQLLVGWITFLDSIPDVSMLDYLPDFLDGLFNMLSDSNVEIRQAADSALSEFLRELSVSTVVEFGPIISILVMQCRSKDRLNRLTAITWLAELIHHPFSGGDALLPTHNADILGAILWCISDAEKEIRLVAERTNDDLLELVRSTDRPFELRALLDTLTLELLHKEDVPTKMAALRWVNMLMEKRKGDMNAFTEDLLPVLLRTLSDPSDAVVLLDLQVLSRISLAQRDEFSVPTEEVQFQLVLNAILSLFAQDRNLLETRGSLIIRKLCVLLNARSVYIRMADTLSSYETMEEAIPNLERLRFIGTMVQTLNLILLTATELQDLRSSLARSFQDGNRPGASDGNAEVFATLFHCWCHNPVATFSLCLLAQSYDLSFALVKRFAEMNDMSVGFLMQIDKLVHLLESPVFVHLRLQLLDVESPYHAPLLKSIYGVLMCLPQGEAFRLLNDRLSTVCNLRDNLGASSSLSSKDEMVSIVTKRGLDMDKLLQRFDDVLALHRAAQTNVQLAMVAEHNALNAELSNRPVNDRARSSDVHPATHVGPPSSRTSILDTARDDETGGPTRITMKRGIRT